MSAARFIAPTIFVLWHSRTSFNQKTKTEEALKIQESTTALFKAATEKQKFSATYFYFPYHHEQTFAGHSALSVNIDGQPINHFGLHPDKLFGQMPTSLLAGSVAKATQNLKEEIECEGFEPEKIEVEVDQATASKLNDLINEKRMKVAQNKLLFSVYPNEALVFAEKQLLGKEVENCALAVSKIAKEAGLIKTSHKLPSDLAGEVERIQRK